MSCLKSLLFADGTDRGAFCTGLATPCPVKLLALVFRFAEITSRILTSPSGVDNIYDRPQSFGRKLNVPFFLSRVSMAEKCFSVCNSTCIAFIVRRSAKFEMQVAQSA